MAWFGGVGPGKGLYSQWRAKDGISMTSYGSTKCGQCSATTTVLLADSCLGSGPFARDPFDTSGWTRCPECRKSYCPKHSQAERICTLCLEGTNQPPASPQGVTFSLHLNADECQALANVLGRVGGDPLRSQRRFVDKIHSHLMDLGFFSQCGNVIDGEIYFQHDRHLRHTFPPGIRRRHQ